MGHFTALGDTARDRAQKQIEEKFKAQNPNISIQWEQTAWETIGEKYMAAWSARTAPDISLLQPGQHRPRRFGSTRWRISARPSSQWSEEGSEGPLAQRGGTPGPSTGRSTSRRCSCSAICCCTARACSTRPASTSPRSRPGSSSPKRARRSWWTVRAATRRRPASTNQPVKRLGLAPVPRPGIGAGIPRLDQFTWDRLNKPDLGPPDWRADHWTCT